MSNHQCLIVIHYQERVFDFRNHIRYSVKLWWGKLWQIMYEIVAPDRN